jgi:hypothetical protein
LGFYAGRCEPYPDSVDVLFPLWLPTLLLSSLNWFVWRKTRPKIMAERAFPVEPTNNSAKSK